MSGLSGNTTLYLPLTPAAQVSTQCGHLEVLDYGSGGNVITKGSTAVYNTNIVKVYDSALSFDGSANGYVMANGVVTNLANATTGTMAYWIYPAVDSNVNDIHLSVCRYASYAGRNSLDCAMLFGASADQLWFACRTDNTTQWAWTSNADYTDAMIGTWVHIAVTHNGTAPLIYVNGTDVTATAGSFTTTTDKTKWWKAVITDATNKADRFMVGAYAYNATIPNYQNCKMSDIRLWTSALTADNITTLYNSGSGTSTAIGSEVFWIKGVQDLSTSGSGIGSVANTVFRDFGNINNTITPTGTATWLAGFAKVWPSVIDLDGDSDYLTSSGTLTSLASATTGSIAFWLYCDAQNNAHNCAFYIGKDGTDTFIIVTYYAGATPYMYVQCYKDATLQWYGKTANSTVVTASWNHVVITHPGDTSGITVYINGTTSTFTYSDTTAKASWFKAVITDATGKADKLKYGLYTTNQYWFNGKISDARLYTGILSQSNVTTLYGAGSGSPAALGGEVLWIKPTAPSIPTFTSTATLSNDEYWIQNGSFEQWASTTSTYKSGTWWTQDGSTAWLQVAGRLSGYAAQITTSSIDRGGSWANTANPAWINTTIVLSAWVKCSTAGIARIGASNGTWVYSPYHSGSGNWERLSLVTTGGATGAVTISANIRTNGGVAQFDDYQIEAGTTPSTYVFNSVKFYSSDLGALSLNGSSDNISIPDSASWDILTGDYTMEMWYRFKALPATTVKQVLISQYASATSYWEWSILNTAGVYTMQFLWYNGQAKGVSVILSPSPTVMTAYHFALTKSGNNYLFFVNGVQQGSTQTNASSVIAVAAAILIGSMAGTNWANAYIGHIRMQADALYLSNFTPPTAPYAANTTTTASGTLSLSGTDTNIKSNSNYWYFDTSSGTYKCVSEGTVALEAD